MRIWMVLGVVVILLTPFLLIADLTNKILFSNKGYAKEIEVKTYILTQQQMGDLFNHPDIVPKQLSVKELNNIDFKNYCVIRVKNLGERHAWGILSCKIPGINGIVKVEIPCIKEYYCDYVVCLSSVRILHNDKSAYPLISYEWSELYTK